MLSPALCGSSKAVVEMTDSPQPILKNASSVEVMPCKQCNCHNKKKNPVSNILFNFFIHVFWYTRHYGLILAMHYFLVSHMTNRSIITGYSIVYSLTP